MIKAFLYWMNKNPEQMHLKILATLDNIKQKKFLLGIYFIERSNNIMIH